MNINTAFPSKYLKSADAEEKDLILTVARVKMETIGQGAKQEHKPVVYFTEVEKGLVLNKTNAKMIGRIAKSDDTDDWTGAKIRLVSAEVEFQGDLVMSLRVRPVAKPPKTEADDARVEAPDEDSIPF